MRNFTTYTYIVVVFSTMLTAIRTLHYTIRYVVYQLPRNVQGGTEKTNVFTAFKGIRDRNTLHIKYITKLLIIYGSVLDKTSLFRTIEMTKIHIVAISSHCIEMTKVLFYNKLTFRFVNNLIHPFLIFTFLPHSFSSYIVEKKLDG